MRYTPAVDQAWNTLFNQLHDAASTRIRSLIEELREEGTGRREVLYLSQSEAWFMTREVGPYFDGPYFTSPGRPHIQDGDGLSEWIDQMAVQIANSVILHVNSALAASDSLGIPDLLQTHSVRRIMEA